MPDMETDVVTDKRTVPMAAVRDTLTGDIIGELVHTALRKYTDRGSAAHRAIAEMPAGEWHRAMDGVANDLIGYIERAAVEPPALTEQDRTSPGPQGGAGHRLVQDLPRGLAVPGGAAGRPAGRRGADPMTAVAAAAQLRLLDAPLASLSIMDIAEANDLLVAWGHRLGPVHRPFRMEAYVLVLNGRPVSVAISASTVSATLGGWLKTASKEEPIRLLRQDVVELARLASSPDALWATRVMLRLWREVCAHQWACWPVRAAVSYSHNALHAGDLYRFDGWQKVNDRCGSSGGGTYSRPRHATDVVLGRKSLWVYEYDKDTTTR